MIEKIIDWSLNNRFMVLLLAVVLIVAGIFSVKNTQNLCVQSKRNDRRRKPIDRTD